MNAPASATRHAAGDTSCRTRPAHAAAIALFSSDLLACAVLRKGRVLHATPAMRKLLGVTGRRAFDLLDHVAEADLERVRAAIHGHRRGITDFTCQLTRAAGFTFPGEIRITSARVGTEQVLLIALNDLTRQVETERRLAAAAHHDALTGLPNRVLLRDRLSHALAVAKRRDRMMALIVLDLDGFKAVNDVHGHAAGDAVLRAVAQRFGTCVRGEDTLARFGGDEFVLVLPEVARHEDAALLAARLVGSLRTPIGLGTAHASIGASVGIAVYPDDGADIETLFARADAAMYAAKQTGRNRYCFANASADVVLHPKTEKLSGHRRLGVAEMDDQHETLFHMLDHLAVTLQSPDLAHQVAGEIQALLAFAVEHFATEERLMREAAYEGLATHRAEHQRLIAALDELAGHTYRIGATLTMRFLRDWLIGHMKSYDRVAALAIRAASAHAKYHPAAARDVVP